MAIDQPKFTDALKPQDAMAVIITLMGLAIVIFLDDSIIKLIGGSIAILGAIALYVTIQQRINDRIQLKMRRTTLPPPAFKTRVTTDPSTSTTRITFDDFQETFAPADDEPVAIEQGEEGFQLSSRSHAPLSEIATPDKNLSGDRGSATTTAGEGMAGAGRRFSFSDDVEDADVSFNDPTGESFRVIKPMKPAESRTISAEPVNRPSVEKQEEVRISPAPVVARPETSPQTEEPAASVAENPVITPTTAAPLPARSAEEPRIEQPRVEQPRIEQPRVEPPRTDQAPTRKQSSFIVEDLISDGDDDGKGSEPRSEFVRLVGQVLNAIARSIQGRSILFFWINFEKGHMIPEAHVTTDRYEIRSGARIRMGNDVVSQIARSGVPEIITDISAVAERELINYYDGPALTRSFIGVPVFYRREVVGVLAADSVEESAFDESSVATLAEYTRLISGLIRSYTEKYDLHLIARTLDAFEQMSAEFSGSAPTPGRVAESLLRQLGELFDTLYIAVVLFDDKREEWRIGATHSEKYSDELGALHPDMRGSLVGRATRFAEEIIVDELQGEIRFAPGETLNSGGTFVALPLVATTKCYGALAVAHASPGAYIQRDVELIRDLSHYAAMAIEVFYTNRAIESQVMRDEATGLYNRDYLVSALDREIARSRDFKDKLSLALISIDMPASIRAERSTELDEVIAASVGAMVQGSLRSYDTVGRFNPDLFGVVLVERDDQAAYIWAEKLRKDVASRILALGGRKSAVTISVGIADLGELNGRDDMINGATQALEKARGGEGNAVILY